MTAPLPPGSRIGILGDGQLGRMLATAAAELGFDIHIFAPEPDSPAARVAARVTVAPYDDAGAISAFAQSVDAVTFEFENIPVATLAACAAHAPIRPGVASLEQTQDRLIEKRFIESLGLRPAPYRAVSTQADLTSAIDQIATPAILKTRRMGYDGKGQVLIRAPQEAPEAWAALTHAPSVLEGFVAFSCEVSVVLARGLDGACAPFAVTQNEHRDGILRRSIAPAPVSAQTAAAAIEAAAAIANALDHVGVLAVEFFVEPDGTLRVNEIAPRVHNSGHWTQDAPGPSQFEQHIRAVAGWPLIAPPPQSHTFEMINLIGEDATDWRKWAQDPHARVHLYGKRQQRQARKMGHITRFKTP